MKILKIVVFASLMVISSSCNNDDDNNSQVLSGIYKEIAPINGRSQLNFVEGNKVVKSEPENSTEDEFTYELIGNIIKLTPTWDNSLATEFEIKIMNSTKFEIENLYPSVGINPKAYMTFEK